MNKILYIRFFDDKTRTIPLDSHAVNTEDMVYLSECGYEILGWMKDYPEGKVDFIWSF
jgi:hypothetical protein